MERPGPKLSTEPYKGVRDFYPEDMAVEKYLFSAMRKTAERFGYTEYGASPLEPAELYRGKTSEEIVNEQTYTFTDRGDREVTLRPEMTPTVARMIAAKKRELQFPLRWYSIPNVFRYERPQRGRLREHFQFNADLFGVATVEAEVELIALAHALLKEFGAHDDDFTIKLNSRAALNALYARHDLSPEQAKAVTGVIDRKLKMSTEEFSARLAEAGGADFKLPTEEPADVARVRGDLARLGIMNTQYDPSVVRGFDYYTGIVFEVFDTHPENNRSLFGGGRYDNLLSLFSDEALPAVGFGMGDVTMRDFLEVRGLIPAYAPETQLYLCIMSESNLPHAMRLAQKLRKAGVNVAVQLAPRKVGDQIATASKKKIPYVVCIGDEEERSGSYRLKNLGTGEEKNVKEEALATTLLKQ